MPNIPLLYETGTMLAAIKSMPPNPTFLRDRYFPTSVADLFPTEEVLVDIQDGDDVIAPCVIPRKKGIVIEREGFRTDRYTPPYVAPERPLTIDDLNRRGFGEGLYPNRPAAERQGEILAQDLMDFDRMISRREESIAAKTLLENGYVLRHYADKYGGSDYEEWELRFYDGTDNPASYTPTTAWNASGANIFGDLQVMIRMLTARGNPVSDLIIAPDVADALINDATFQKYLDIRNFQMGRVAPSALPSGAAHLASINVFGHPIDVFTYDATYKDEAGNITPYIPSGRIILTAPACGRGLYGAVTQLEAGDGSFHTYAERRVPKYISDENADVRTLRVTSRPLFIPRRITPWVSADVL